MSYPEVRVQNSTKFSVTGTVKYAACSSDDFNLSTGTYFEHSRGVCLITKITAVVHLPSGQVNASSYDSSGTSYSQFAVIENLPGKYAVTRVVTLVSNDASLVKSGLKESAAFYGIKHSADIDAIGLKILEEQQGLLEANWPKNAPKIAYSHSGNLLCALRSSDKSQNKSDEVSCVHGSLEEINTDSKLGLNKNDIDALAKHILKAMLKSNSKLKFTHETFKCENGKTLHWGLSATSEPVENDKDAIIYSIGLSLS